MQEPLEQVSEGAVGPVRLWKAPAWPVEEAARQKALDSYQILDTEAEQCYDDLTRLAELICGTPTAMLSLIDHHRQWFKSRIGMEAGSTPRDVSFCGHAILEPGEIFEVPDARKDARFVNTRLLKKDPESAFTRARRC